MPQVNDPGKERKEPRQFMREKIVKQPRSKRQIAERALAFLFIAVIFGIVAAVSFVLTRPAAEKLFGKEPTKESVPITIPRDEQETPPPTQPSVEPTIAETEPIEEVLKSALETYEYSVEDLNAIFTSLRSVVQDVDKGIVVVHSVKVETDWFDNPIERTGLYAGAVIASTGGEALILTPEAAVEQADSIRVTLSDGTEVGGTIRQSDKISGMAIVSVSSQEITSEVWEDIAVIELGNSYSVKQGDMVIAVGSPAGPVHSTGYGFVSYVARNVQVPDGVTRVLYTDLKGMSTQGTFLLNTSGQMIGWLTDEYKSDESSRANMATSISDYKGILEKLTNGVPAPYFGIEGQEVTSAMVETGMPQGVYVVNSISDGPAYNAGIQNGDVITKIGTKEITTLNEFQIQVEGMSTGDVVQVTVQRNGRDEYREIEFPVTIGSR